MRVEVEGFKTLIQKDKIGHGQKGRHFVGFNQLINFQKENLMDTFHTDCEACKKRSLFIFRSLIPAFLFFIMISFFNLTLPSVVFADDGGLLENDVIQQDQGIVKDQDVMENEGPSQDEGVVQDQGPSKDEDAAQDGDNAQDQGDVQRDEGEAPAELTPE